MLRNFYVPTKQNPADDPSRAAPLRRALVLPARLRHLVTAERTASTRSCTRHHNNAVLCLEVFSGAGNLSNEMEAQGFGVAAPMETFPSPGIHILGQDLEYDATYTKLLQECSDGLYTYVHFGLVCTTWSSLWRWNKQCTRTTSNPLGDGSNLKEVRANLMTTRICALCKVLVDKGLFFSIENPTVLLFSNPLTCLT